MTHRSRWPGVYVLGLLVAAGALALCGPDGGAPASAEGVSPAGATVPNIVGDWVGTWTDTVYAVTGDLSWEISQVREDLTAAGMIDMSYFAMGDIEGEASGTITGTSRAETLHFTFQAPMIGDGSGTVTGGVGAGVGTVGPPLGFGAFTFEGTVTDTTIRGRFYFTSPGAGAGRALLMRDETPVERASWGTLKARYRDGDE